MRGLDLYEDLFQNIDLKIFNGEKISRNILKKKNSPKKFAIIKQYEK